MPIIPSPKFHSKSGLNAWGDFVMQVDWTVGQVMDAIQSGGFSDNTLLVVTSDNGSTPHANFAELGKLGHDPSYHYRGHKADIFEGGHHVPFVARWPALIPAGTKNDETICHTDLLATVADITRYALPANAGEDSVSILPLLDGSYQSAVREATVHHSAKGAFAIRRGKWKLCFCPGSGGWSPPNKEQAKQQNLPSVQLYDLSVDVAEKTNLEAAHPEVVEELTSLMQHYVDQGRSTPGEQQPNDREVVFGY